MLCSSSADWKYRHAGLMALSAIGEGCHQQMEAILNEIVSFVLLFCQDPVSLCVLVGTRLGTLEFTLLMSYTQTLSVLGSGGMFDRIYVYMFC